MKNICFYLADKYRTTQYQEVDSCIYKCGDVFCTTLSFEQEPSYDEGVDAANIAQYPLEAILDKFGLYVSDFYPLLNIAGSNTCYIEFASDRIECIFCLLSIVGKHVINKLVCENGEQSSVLIIE